MAQWWRRQLSNDCAIAIGVLNVAHIDHVHVLLLTYLSQDSTIERAFDTADQTDWPTSASLLVGGRQSRVSIDEAMTNVNWKLPAAETPWQ